MAELLPPLQSALGLCVLTLLAWAMGGFRTRGAGRLVLAGLGLQIAVALLLVKLPQARQVFIALNDAVLALQRATEAGTSFVFGFLGGGPPPFEPSQPQNLFVLAFQALPLLLVMSALSAVLFHWRVLPLVVRGVAWALRRTMGLGGAAGTATAANVFVGMVEAPLMIRPYLASMSRADLFVVMVGGMATIAGTVMALYASFLQGVVPQPIGHLLTASLISAPAAVLVARLMVPAPDAAGGQDAEMAKLPFESTMEALVWGTGHGVLLLMNVVAMLLVAVALVALANECLGLLPAVGGEALSFQRLAGWLFAPVAWLMGVPADQSLAAGGLLGTKTVLNELIAYLQLAGLPPGTLDERSRLIMTYALCGFANFGSLGIVLAGMTTMAPERRVEIAGLGLRSIVGGTLATCMTGAVVGIVLA